MNISHILSIPQPAIRVNVFDSPVFDSFLQEKAWEYDDIGAKSGTGIEDIICGTGNLYAYTREKQTELIIRKIDDQEFLKKLEMKYSLMHFAFHDDGNGIYLITLGSNSHFQDLDKEVIISFLALCDQNNQRSADSCGFLLSKIQGIN